MKKMLFLLNFFVNIMFINFNNPLMLGINLLMQTLITSILMGKIYYSFWFSYIMFMVFIGGLFILFIYVISLIFNNNFYTNKNLVFYLLMSLLFLNYNYFYFNNNETNMNLLINENFNFLKFFNFPNNLINIMLIIYLFILMIIVIKITNFLKGPFRQTNQI